MIFIDEGKITLAMIWFAYGHRMFPCIRRIQKRKQPDRGFYSIFLRIDNKKSVHCKQSSKKDIF